MAILNVMREIVVFDLRITKWKREAMKFHFIKDGLDHSVGFLENSLFPFAFITQAYLIIFV